MKTPSPQAHNTAVLTGLLSLWLFSPATAADFSGNLKGVTITDSQATNKPPVAAFSYTVSGTIVSFNASGSSDADGTISEYKWDFGDGSYGTGVQVEHTYTTKTTTPVTLSLLDNNNGIALDQQTIVFQEPFNLAVNFQPATSAVPAGFLPDSGENFNILKGYGWITPPNSVGARDRNHNLSPDQAFDTLLCAVPEAVWEYVVPNGLYHISVTVGDPAAPDRIQGVQVEGMPLIVAEPLNSNNLWISREIDVNVADGRLTLTFQGSNTAKICFVKATSSL